MPNAMEIGYPLSCWNPYMYTCMHISAHLCVCVCERWCMCERSLYTNNRYIYTTFTATKCAYSARRATGLAICLFMLPRLLRVASVLVVATRLMFMCLRLSVRIATTSPKNGFVSILFSPKSHWAHACTHRHTYTATNTSIHIYTIINTQMLPPPLLQQSSRIRLVHQ